MNAEARGVAKHFVVFIYPQLLRLSLLAWVMLALANGRACVESVRGLVGRKTLAALAVISLVALTLRLWAIPNTHHVFYDELKHLDLARNLALTGSFGETLVAGRSNFNWVGMPPYWPAGFHTLLGLVFTIFGYSEASAYALNAILGGLAVPLLFLSSLLLWQDEGAALLSAFVLCFLPVHLKFSGSTDLSVCSFFWMLGSLLAFLLYRKRRTGMALALWLVTLNYAVHSRPENLLLGVMLAAWDLWERSSENKRRLLGLALLIMAVPLLLLVEANFAIFARVFGGSLKGLWINLRTNVPDNLRYFLEPVPQGVLLGFGISGAFAAFRLDRNATFFFLAYSALFFLVYSAFYFGDFTHWDWPAAADRYSLALYLPLLALGGLGLARAVRCCPSPKIAAGFACAGLLVLGAPAYNQMFEPLLDQQLRYRFLMDSAGLLPKDAYVITFLPGAIASLTGRPAVSSYLMLNERAALEAAIIQHDGRAPQYVLFKDFWWYQPWRPVEDLRRALNKDYVLSPISESDLGFGFYLLKPRLGVPGGRSRE